MTLSRNSLNSILSDNTADFDPFNTASNSSGVNGISINRYIVAIWRVFGRPGTVQIALQKPEPPLLEGQHPQLLWPPKIESSNLESAHAVVYYGIVSPDQQFENVSELKTEVEKDNLGKFYFSPSPAFLSVDTIYYHD